MENQRTARMGHEEESWIWDYATRLGKSVNQIGPADFQLQWTEAKIGGTMRLTCTMRTAPEAEAVREIIRTLALKSLSANRPMVHGDISWEPPPATESYSEKVARMFGAFPTGSPHDRA